jgi:hypothetical protein
MDTRTMRIFAKHWRRPRPGQMNALEARYGLHLEALRREGKIVWFKYEAIKLRLADKTFYTPDFLIVTADGTFEAHETKGFWTDDARVKIKCAAEIYPIRFVALKWVKGEWQCEEI